MTISPQSLDLARVAIAVQDCPGVAALHPGAHGAIATTTPLGQLFGLFHHRNVLIIGVVALAVTAETTEESDTALIEQVRAAVSHLAPGTFVVVTVVDRHRRTSPAFADTALPRPGAPPTDLYRSVPHYAPHIRRVRPAIATALRRAACEPRREG